MTDDEDAKKVEESKQEEHACDVEEDEKDAQTGGDIKKEKHARKFEVIE